MSRVRDARRLRADGFSRAEAITGASGLAAARRKHDAISAATLERTEDLEKRLRLLSDAPDALGPPSAPPEPKDAS